MLLLLLFPHTSEWCFEMRESRAHCCWKLVYMMNWRNFSMDFSSNSNSWVKISVYEFKVMIWKQKIDQWMLGAWFADWNRGHTNRKKRKKSGNEASLSHYYAWTFEQSQIRKSECSIRNKQTNRNDQMPWRLVKRSIQYHKNITKYV